MKTTKTERILDFKGLKKLTQEMSTILIFREPLLFLWNPKFIKLHFQLRREFLNKKKKYNGLCNLKSKAPSYSLFYKYIPFLIALGFTIVSLIGVYWNYERNMVIMTGILPFLLLFWIFHKISRRILDNYKIYVLELKSKIEEILKYG